MSCWNWNCFNQSKAIAEETYEMHAPALMSISIITRSTVIWSGVTPELFLELGLILDSLSKCFITLWCSDSVCQCSDLDWHARWRIVSSSFVFQSGIIVLSRLRVVLSVSHFNSTAEDIRDMHDSDWHTIWRRVSPLAVFQLGTMITSSRSRVVSFSHFDNTAEERCNMHDFDWHTRKRIVSLSLVFLWRGTWYGVIVLARSRLLSFMISTFSTEVILCELHDLDWHTSWRIVSPSAVFQLGMSHTIVFSCLKVVALSFFCHFSITTVGTCDMHDSDWHTSWNSVLSSAVFHFGARVLITKLKLASFSHSSITAEGILDMIDSHRHTSWRISSPSADFHSRLSGLCTIALTIVEVVSYLSVFNITSEDIQCLQT